MTSNLLSPVGSGQRVRALLADTGLSAVSMLQEGSLVGDGVQNSQLIAETAGCEVLLHRFQRRHCLFSRQSSGPWAPSHTLSWRLLRAIGIRRLSALVLRHLQVVGMLVGGMSAEDALPYLEDSLRFEFVDGPATLWDDVQEWVHLNLCVSTRERPIHPVSTSQFC